MSAAYSLQFKRGFTMLVHRDLPRINRLKFLTLHSPFCLIGKKIYKLNGQPLLLMRQSAKLQNGSFQHAKSKKLVLVSLKSITMVTYAQPILLNIFK